MTSITFYEYGKKSEMIQLVEGNCLRNKVEELPYITKVHCSINNMEKLVSIMSYIDETLFEKMYEKITHLKKIPVWISVVKASLHFWDPNYKCSTFKDIDMTLIITDYTQILNFPNSSHKVYFKQKIRDTTAKVAKLLHLDKIYRYKTTYGSFKWKLIEARLNTNKNEGKLGDERYQAVVFAIFELVLFPS